MNDATPTSRILQFQSDSPEDTADLAKRLAAVVSPGTTIALIGTLGVGKTYFSRAFAAACGIPEEQVVSPTFVICHQHESPKFRINHLDVYRLSGGDEFVDLGAEEMMESESVQLIEWADQVADYLPDERLEIEFQVTGENSRTISVTAYGHAMTEKLKKLEPAS